MVVGSGWLDSSPALLVAEGPPGNLSINTFVLDPGGWSSRAALRKADNSLASFPEDLSWTFFQSQVAAARLDDQGQVEVGLWSCV